MLDARCPMPDATQCVYSSADSELVMTVMIESVDLFFLVPN